MLWAYCKPHIYCILYTVYCILYTVCCILYTVYCILYTVHLQVAGLLPPVLQPGHEGRAAGSHLPHWLHLLWRLNWSGNANPIMNPSTNHNRGFCVPGVSCILTESALSRDVRLCVLEGAARYAVLLLAPVEDFCLRPGPFVCPSGKKRAFW